MVGIVVQMTTDTKWYQVAVGRLVAGLGVGALSSLVPMYQSESCPRHIRGAMVRSVPFSHIPPPPFFPETSTFSARISSNN